jgi:hypothetical protein
MKKGFLEEPISNDLSKCKAKKASFEYVWLMPMEKRDKNK